MYDYFTDEADQVMMRANQEAERARLPHLGTEHILLALLDQEGGAAAKILTTLGLDREALRAGARQALAPGGGPLPRAAAAIQFAIEEARGRQPPVVGAEHLLLGILREPEGVAGSVLRGAGLTLERARAEVAAQSRTIDG